MDVLRSQGQQVLVWIHSKARRPYLDIVEKIRIEVEASDDLAWANVGTLLLRLLHG